MLHEGLVLSLSKDTPRVSEASAQPNLWVSISLLLVMLLGKRTHNIGSISERSARADR